MATQQATTIHLLRTKRGSGDCIGISVRLISNGKLIYLQPKSLAVKKYTIGGRITNIHRANVQAMVVLRPGERMILNVPQGVRGSVRAERYVDE